MGSIIHFFFFGTDLARVTLSVEDDIGKSLHFEMRLNEGCKGDPPQLLFNTKENGVFGKGEAVDIELAYPYISFDVSLKQDGYLIETYDFSHTFAYRPPHQLSEIRKVKLYTDQGCSENAHFLASSLSLKHKFTNSFSKIEIQGTFNSQESNVKTLATFHFTYNKIGPISIEKGFNYLIAFYKANYFCTLIFPTQLPPNPIYGIILEYSAEENEYELTISIDDEVKSGCKKSLRWVEPSEGEVTILLDNITKFNIEQ